MLVPKVNKITNPNLEEIVIEVDETKKITKESIHNEIFFIEKSMESYIKYIEKLVRSSLEYRSYIYTIRHEFDINRCKFFKDIDIDKTKVNLEFHHYPFTLYDIVALTICDQINRYGNFESGVTNAFRLAESIVKLHYENKVGLVPLTQTVHELCHNGSIFIPLNDNYVFGDYNTFFNSILDCEMKQNYIGKLDLLKEITKDIENGKELNDTSILEDLKVKIEMTSAELPQPIIKEDSMAV